jgi:hypothetical protein
LTYGILGVAELVDVDGNSLIRSHDGWDNGGGQWLKQWRGKSLLGGKQREGVKGRQERGGRGGKGRAK